VTAVATASPPAETARPGSFEASLALAQRLVDDFESFAASLGDLDPIDLPPVLGGELDQARLRSLGPMYLAAELEAARLVPAAETLAALFVSGGLPDVAGRAGELLVALWRARNERFNREERAAFFNRLFGTGSGPVLAVPEPTNVSFESELIDLAASIHRLDSTFPYREGIPSDAGLRTAATLVGASLSSRRSGIPEQAAADLLAAVKEALEIFKQPEVQTALGALGSWGAVAAVVRRYLREEVDVALHVERARSGLALLAWLAESAPVLGGAGALPLPGPEVRAAAQSWLQATLALQERSTGAASAA
jgi:hypothetical protein